MKHRIITLGALTPADWEAAAAAAGQADAALGRDTSRLPEAARRRHVAGWWLACKLLTEATGVPLSQLRLAADVHGKPVCQNGPVGFSISHAGDRVLCAVHEGAVGADIEVFRAVSPALLRRVCTPAERAYVQPAGAVLPLRFLEVWTAKEAYVKYTGRGLGAGLKTVIAANEAGLLPAINGHPLLPLAGEDYRGAIVI